MSVLIFSPVYHYVALIFARTPLRAVAATTLSFTVVVIEILSASICIVSTRDSDFRRAEMHYTHLSMNRIINIIHVKFMMLVSLPCFFKLQLTRSRRITSPWLIKTLSQAYAKKLVQKINFSILRAKIKVHNNFVKLKVLYFAMWKQKIFKRDEKCLKYIFRKAISTDILNYVSKFQIKSQMVDSYLNKITFDREIFGSHTIFLSRFDQQTPGLFTLARSLIIFSSSLITL